MGRVGEKYNHMVAVTYSELYWDAALRGLGWGSGSVAKNPPAMQELQEMQVQSLGWEDLLEEGMATHSSILAWRIPWTEEPGRLQSTGLQRVGHTEATQNGTHILRTPDISV